jgi:transposase
MDKYIGLDVHLKSCTLAVLNAAGKQLSWQVVETNGEALVEAVKGVSGNVHICLEEGTQSAWVYEILSPLVAEVIVIALSERVQGNKNDKEDAFRLAELHRTRTFKRCVYKEVGTFKQLRNLVRAYGFVTVDLVRCQNRLKAAYRAEGVATPGTALYREDSKEEWVVKLDVAHQVGTGFLHDQYRALEQLKEAAEKAMVKEAARHKAFKLLQTVPGVGPIRAAQLLSLVVTPSRFRTKRQFWSYCGLAIVTHSSSDWVKEGGGQWERKKVQQTRGLNRNHNHLMKGIMKGAAQTVLQQSGGALRTAYERLLEKGTKPNLAALTIARKIAAIILTVWKKNEGYYEAYEMELAIAKERVNGTALKT